MNPSKRLGEEIEVLVKEGRTSEILSLIQHFAADRYREGYKHALANYATWQDGEQYVGVLRTPLKVALDEVDNSQVPIIY